MWINPNWRNPPLRIWITTTILIASLGLQGEAQGQRFVQPLGQGQPQPPGFQTQFSPSGQGQPVPSGFQTLFPQGPSRVQTGGSGTIQSIPQFQQQGQISSQFQPQGQVPLQQFQPQGQVPLQQFQPQGQVPLQQFQQGQVPSQQFQQGQVPPQQFQQGQVPPQQFQQRQVSPQQFQSQGQIPQQFQSQGQIPQQFQQGQPPPQQFQQGQLPPQQFQTGNFPSQQFQPGQFPSQQFPTGQFSPQNAQIGLNPKTSSFPPIGNFGTQGNSAMSKLAIWETMASILSKVKSSSPDYILPLQPELLKGIPTINISHALIDPINPQILKALVTQSSGMLVSQQAAIAVRLRNKLGESNIIHMILGSENPGEIINFFNPHLLRKNIPVFINAIGEFTSNRQFELNQLKVKLLPTNFLSIMLNTINGENPLSLQTLTGRTFENGLLISLSLNSINCQQINRIQHNEIVPFFGIFRNQLYGLRNSIKNYNFPINLRNCGLDSVLRHLAMKNGPNDTNVLRRLDMNEIDGIGGELLTGIPTEGLNNIPLEIRREILIEIGQVQMFDLLRLAPISQLQWYGRTLLRDLSVNSSPPPSDSTLLAIPQAIEQPIEVNMQSLFKLGNLFCYANLLKANITKDSLRQLLNGKLSPGGKTCCLDPIGQSTWSIILKQSIGSDTGSWKSEDLQLMGDLMVALTDEDIEKISVPELTQIIGSLLASSGLNFPMHLSGIDQPITFGRACVTLLQDGFQFKGSYRALMRKYVMAMESRINFVQITQNTPNDSGMDSKRFVRETNPPIVDKYERFTSWKDWTEYQQHLRYAYARNVRNAGRYRRQVQIINPGMNPQLVVPPPVQMNRVPLQGQQPIGTSFINTNPNAPPPNTPPQPQQLGSTFINMNQRVPLQPQQVGSNFVNPNPRLQSQPQQGGSNFPNTNPMVQSQQPQQQNPQVAPPNLQRQPGMSPQVVRPVAQLPVVQFPTRPQLPQTVSQLVRIQQQLKPPRTQQQPSMGQQQILNPVQMQRQSINPLQPQMIPVPQQIPTQAQIPQDSAIQPQVQDIGQGNDAAGSTSGTDEHVRSLPEELPKLSCNGIKAAGPAVIGLEVADFESLDTSDLGDCIETIGLIDWPDDMKPQLLNLYKKKLNLTSTQLSTLSLIELGSLVTALSTNNQASSTNGLFLPDTDFQSDGMNPFDIGSINLTLPTSLDTLSILGTRITQPEMLKVIGEKFSEENGLFKIDTRSRHPSHLRIVLWSLGNIICGLDETILKNIFDSDKTIFIDLSPILGRLEGCDFDMLSTLAHFSVMPNNYGSPDTWTREDVNTIGVVVAGLNPDSLASITPEGMQGLHPLASMVMSTAQFQNLSPIQLSNFTYETVKSMDSNIIIGLSTEQVEALNGVINVPREDFNIPPIPIDPVSTEDPTDPLIDPLQQRSIDEQQQHDESKSGKHGPIISSNVTVTSPTKHSEIIPDEEDVIIIIAEPSDIITTNPDILVNQSIPIGSNGTTPNLGANGMTTIRPESGDGVSNKESSASPTTSSNKFSWFIILTIQSIMQATALKIHNLWI